VRNVSLAIKHGELSSIIGPNGAGKTTLFNLITGYIRPDSGRILYYAQPIEGLAPHTIARMGIGRAFQIPAIFPELSVSENVRAAVISRLGLSLKFAKEVSKFRQVRKRVDEILEQVGLLERADQVAGTLAHGDQKRLDLAIALAMEPSILLLDEPTSGMSPEERSHTVSLIKELWERRKLTLVFIEHDMDVVFSISQVVRVLHYGELIAEGTPDEISRNERVVEAYLGREETSV